jgi:ABC-2 type transport system ATP-binding protein
VADLSPRSLLEARGLVRRYGQRAAVAGLSFQVGRGEIFGVLGPNGAGKTTTFELLSGLRAAHEGELLWDGAPVSPTSAAFRARLGVLFQKPSVDDKLTARENLLLGAALYGVTGSRAKERIERTLALVELSDRADELVARFSGGMRRRLELGRVLLHEPELLILDEPTQGLDPSFFQKFWAQIADLCRLHHLTVLLTTHDPMEAEKCDRLTILDQGRIIAQGSPSELKACVGGDVITVDAESPSELLPMIQAKLELEATLVDGKLVLSRPRGHELVPRLVELFPAGRLKSVSLRPPNLADVFIKLTGRALVPTLPETGKVAA